MTIKETLNNNKQVFEITEDNGNLYLIEADTEGSALEKYTEIKEREANRPNPLDTLPNVNTLNEITLDSILNKIDEENLTEEQLEKFNQVYNRKLKLQTRKEFVKQVGDIEDQVADIDKQTQIFSPIVIKLLLMFIKLLDVLNSNEILNKEAFLTSLENNKETIEGNEVDNPIITNELLMKYLTFGTEYLLAINTGQYKDRIDVEPDEREMLNGLLINNVKKGLLAEDYISRKKH